MIKRISGCLLMAALLIAPQILFTSCSDDDSSGGGTPEITGVRSCDPATADSLFTKASPGQVIAIIGHNLSHVMKVYINDQEVYFNPNMNTDHSIIVSVPTEKNGFKLTAFNSDLKDEIRVETTHGTCTYYFKISAGFPSLQRIAAKYPRETGDLINVYGLNLTDIEEAYFTSLTTEEIAELKSGEEIGGTHVPITDLKTIRKDRGLNAMTNAYETQSQLAFNLPDLPFTEGTLVIVTAGGTAYIPYSKTPGKPVILYVSSDMPQIGERLYITGREFVEVSSVQYGDITLSPGEFEVASTEDTIFVNFAQKPSVGSTTTLTITTPGGEVTAERFYDYTSILTTFDGDATDNGWSPNASYVDSGTADGVYAYINLPEEGLQWWGTMIYFRKDWNGNKFTLPDFSVIPADTPTDQVFLAMEVFNDNSSYNDGVYAGYLRYFLQADSEDPVPEFNDQGGANPVDQVNQFDNFSWDDYNAQTFLFVRPVLADYHDQAPVGQWYRHVLPISSFAKYRGKTYQALVNDGINQFRIQDINQSTTRGKIDVKFDNVRIIYIPNN